MNRHSMLFVILLVFFVLCPASNAQSPKKGAANQIPQPINGSRLLQFDDGIKQMATGIRTHIKKKTGQKRVAVMPLRNIETETTHLGKQIAVRLCSDLFEPDSITIVERLKLDQVLKEHKLSESGAFDQETAKKLGGLAKADVIITGSHADLDDHLEIDISAIDCNTGDVIGVARANVAWTGALRRLAGGHVVADGSRTEERTQTPAFEDKHWHLELVSCELLKDGRLKLTISVKNRTDAKDAQLMWMETGQSRTWARNSASLVSDNGVTWSIDETTMADEVREQFGAFMGLSKDGHSYEPLAERPHTFLFKPERADKPIRVKLLAKVSTLDPDFFQKNQQGGRVYGPQIIDVALDKIPVPFKKAVVK